MLDVESPACMITYPHSGIGSFSSDGLPSGSPSGGLSPGFSSGRLPPGFSSGELSTVACSPQKKYAPTPSPRQSSTSERKILNHGDASPVFVTGGSISQLTDSPRRLYRLPNACRLPRNIRPKGTFAFNGKARQAGSFAMVSRPDAPYDSPSSSCSSRMVAAGSLKAHGTNRVPAWMMAGRHGRPVAG